MQEKRFRYALSSEYWGYLAHFLALSQKKNIFFYISGGNFSNPRPKNKKKNYPEKISYIFPKKKLLYFMMTADQAGK